MRTSLVLAVLLFATSLAAGDFKLAAGDTWIDTSLDLKSGDIVTFEASGQLTYPGAKNKPDQTATPAGLKRGWADLARSYPVNDAGLGAVIGRIGDSVAARAFLIGDKLTIRAPIAGRLFLGVNQPSSPKPIAGDYAIKVSIEKAAKVEAYSGPLPELPADIWKRVPRRVSDPAGTPGDRVNFVILGSQAQVTDALAASGWVIVDKTTQASILRGVLDSISGKAYLTMPMSDLRLFERTQDYGFAHSEPVVTVSTRHHFRLWKAPFTASDGSEVWIGAGTHDIGFDKDERNGNVTHKIDPDTDKEREFIAESLRQTGEVVKTGYVTPPDTVTRAKTAHGEEFTSDGRILIIWLTPSKTPPQPTGWGTPR